MTLVVNVIQKVTGNYKAIYTGRKITRTTPVSIPVSTPISKARRTVRTVATRKGMKTGAAVGSPLSLADYVRNNPNAGIPIKGDKITFIKIDSNVYNGVELPIPSERLPAYILTNQRGEILRMVDSMCKKITGSLLDIDWRYLHNAGTDNDLESALRNVKRLKTWQTCANRTAAESNKVTLPRKGWSSANGRKFEAMYLLDQLKKQVIKQKTMIVIDNYPYPAKILYETLRNLAGEIIEMITDEITKTLTVSYSCDGLKGRSIIKSQFYEGDSVNWIMAV